MFKQKIVDLIAKTTNLPKERTNHLVEVPPNPDLGDYSFPCFVLADPKNYDEVWEDVEKDFFIKKSPAEIASHLKDLIEKKLPPEVEKVDTKGPYLNFFINKKKLATQIIKINSNYGKGKDRRKTLVEYASPNASKPLHLGHLRNIAIGESMSRIFEFNGNKVFRVNLNNDKGMPISKTMIAYKKFGKNKTPESEKIKSDHFVGDLYVLYGKKETPELEKETRDLLKLQEAGDKETIKLWKKIVGWALSGYHETYTLFGAKFDKEYYESQIYEEGKDIVKEGLKKNVFEKRDDGAVVINLGFVGKENLGEKVLLRSDGTAVYMTQDLELAKQKQKHFDSDISINVVGSEHNYHFKVLYEILRKLGHKETHHHLSYGLISLPEGRMKSREGKVVDADDLISDVKNLAKKEIEAKAKKKLSKKEIEKRSLTIALGAIKYTLLKIEAERNFVFNPKESLDFEGNTGPYLQYSYARASSIIKKAKKSTSSSKISDLSKSEETLIKNISNFPEKVEIAGKKMNPAIIANYAYDLAKSFNEFYHANPVIGSKEQAFRLKLVEAFRITLKNALFLLGIEVMEEM